MSTNDLSVQLQAIFATGNVTFDVIPADDNHQTKVVIKVCGESMCEWRAIDECFTPCDNARLLDPWHLPPDLMWGFDDEKWFITDHTNFGMLWIDRDDRPHGSLLNRKNAVHLVNLLCQRNKTEPEGPQNG